jgi:hypothetical protein
MIERSRGMRGLEIEIFGALWIPSFSPCCLLYRHFGRDVMPKSKTVLVWSPPENRNVNGCDILFPSALLIAWLVQAIWKDFY